MPTLTARFVIKVTGLQAGKTYYYQFMAGSVRSKVVDSRPRPLNRPMCSK